MSTVKQEFFNFFDELSQNNNREWFNENKSRFEREVKEPFTRLVEDSINRMSQDDASFTLVKPADSIFRIYKDVRFSADKTPYKLHMAAVLGKGGRKGLDGIYLHLGHDGTFIGGGAYDVPKEKLNAVRSFLLDNKEEFESIIQDPQFVKMCGEIKGERYVRTPEPWAQYVSDFPYMANKQWYFMKEFDKAKFLKSKDQASFVYDYHLAAKPYCDFIVQALKGS